MGVDLSSGLSMTQTPILTQSCARLGSNTVCKGMGCTGIALN